MMLSRQLLPHGTNWESDAMGSIGASIFLKAAEMHRRTVSEHDNAATMLCQKQDGISS